LGHKDLVKVENFRLTDKQLQLVGLFAAGATYSIIENYQVVGKQIVTLPQMVEQVIICPNLRCISHQYRSLFQVAASGGKVSVSCHYCEQSFLLSSLTNFNFE
jgi:aspartate carbamoyltransferase regulatory subunit